MPSPKGLLPAGDRSVCPVANVLDLLGDRWTLLVVRDLLFFRKVRYNELADTLERIPTNILADRLRRLEAAGIVEKGAYQDRPVRYEYRLTARGMDLLPVLREMIGWAKRHIAITGKRPRIRAGRSTGSPGELEPRRGKAHRRLPRFVRPADPPA
jgi:DNA-binding HxlR family transcriptional regulator